MESVILAFITIIGVCFLVEIFLAKPSAGAIVQGLVPRLTGESLYVAIGILGATVMPHNLYLHSSLVQTRNIGAGDQAKRAACRFNLIDSVVALNGALLINAAILILAASLFFSKGIVVTEIQQAHQLLAPLLGTTVAAVMFAVALICSGQASTITGTMAGQIVMEGFLNFRMRPWLRRLVTRLLAVTPAVLTIAWAGEKSTFKLLILSQVILSLQLPFAVIPLVQFTSDRRRMGSFANKMWVRILAWTTAAIIVALNLRLAMAAFSDWVAAAGSWILVLLIPLAAGLLALLVYIALQPRLSARPPAAAPALPEPPVAAASATALYRRILVPLDHTGMDAPALRHAAALARLHQAKIHLLHVEEGVASQVYGDLASTAEIEEGRLYFNSVLDALRAQHIDAELHVVFSNDPKAEIIRLVGELNPDLLVMGAHGHKGLKDILFGATINEVRHAVATPVLIVRDDGGAG
jgi:manganese transport protein